MPSPTFFNSIRIYKSFLLLYSLFLNHFIFSLPSLFISVPWLIFVITHFPQFPWAILSSSTRSIKISILYQLPTNKIFSYFPNFKNQLHSYRRIDKKMEVNFHFSLALIFYILSISKTCGFWNIPRSSKNCSRCRKLGLESESTSATTWLSSWGSQKSGHQTIFLIPQDSTEVRPPPHTVLTVNEGLVSKL